MPGPSATGEPVTEELTEVWASVVTACEQLDAGAMGPTHRLSGLVGEGPTWPI